MKVLQLGGTPSASTSRLRIAVAVSDRLGPTRASIEAEEGVCSGAALERLGQAVAVCEV